MPCKLEHKSGLCQEIILIFVKCNIHYAECPVKSVVMLLQLLSKKDTVLQSFVMVLQLLSKKT